MAFTGYHFCSLIKRAVSESQSKKNRRQALMDMLSMQCLLVVLDKAKMIHYSSYV
ncbi:hypothetical protein J6590_087985 [Homalodisca vitripennis]|nr:hypothetical protein J6590_087985 [Homalodisca vitripennis]